MNPAAESRLDDQAARYFKPVERVLASCMGRPRAMTIDTIQQLAGVPDRRTTEKVLESYLDRFPWPLVAGSAGYFIPIRGEAEEINRYKHNLRGRHNKLKRREDTVDVKARASGFVQDADGFFKDPPENAQAELFAGSPP